MALKWLPSGKVCRLLPERSKSAARNMGGDFFSWFFFINGFAIQEYGLSLPGSDGLLQDVCFVIRELEEVEAVCVRYRCIGGSAGVWCHLATEPTAQQRDVLRGHGYGECSVKFAVFFVEGGFMGIGQYDGYLSALGRKLLCEVKACTTAQADEEE